MRWATVQMTESGKPIEHKWNKDWREPIDMGTETAKVKYSTGITLNLGNYQSAKVDVGVELPFDYSKGQEVMDEIYNTASSWCTEKLQEEIAFLSELKKGLK